MAFEDDLLALERQVLIKAAGDFLQAVAELRLLLAASAPGVQRKLLQLAIPRVEAAARAGVLEGYQLGAGQALDLVDAGDRPVAVKAASRVPVSVVSPVTGLDDLLVKAHRQTVALLKAGLPAAEAAGPVFNAATTVKATIETQINEASNTAARQIGAAVEAPMVWEAERDACVYCLALAGKVVERAGDEFPAADLYAVPPPSQRTVSQPPLHPHCRCRLSILVDESYAAALEREAQRSILRGFSLQSESQAVRVNAARRLLERDPVAPKSVLNYARKAVKEGKFPRGRDVPDGDPRLIIK